MKNFKHMKTGLLLAVLALVGMVSPVKAAISATDVYGKYKFTSTATMTEAGKAYADKFKTECEVVITSVEINDGQIIGLAGTSGSQRFNVVGDSLELVGPNTYASWGGLSMSYADGKYPFGYFPKLAYNAEDKSISVPDFSLVKIIDNAAMTAELMVNFTNAKLTLIEAEQVEVADLSGDWHFKASDPDSTNIETYPAEFDFTLTAKDESKKTYTAVMTYGNFEPVTMDATFDGVEMNLLVNETYLSKENQVMIYGRENGRPTRQGPISFQFNSETSLSLTGMMYFVQMATEPDGKNLPVQSFTVAAAKKQGAQAFTWAGTFNMHAEKATAINAAYEFAQDFNIVIADKDGVYYVTEIMGYDVTALNNYGMGMKVEVDANDPNKAQIVAGYRILKTVTPGEVYLVLADMNNTQGAISITREADGTITMPTISVSEAKYQSAEYTIAGFYQNITGKAENAGGDEVAFTWAGTFNMHAEKATAINAAYEFAQDFNIVIADKDGVYYVTEIMGYDVTALNNYGMGMKVEVDANDPNKAQIAAGYRILKTVTPGEVYLVLADMNNTQGVITITREADGTFTMPTISVSEAKYQSTEYTIAGFYQNITGSVDNGGGEVVAFDWAGTFNMSAGDVMVKNDAYEYAKDFTLVIKHIETDYVNGYYLTEIMGNDVTALNNYGSGMLIEIDANDPNKAQIAAGNRLMKTVEPGVRYLALADMNNTNSPIELTAEADGSIKIANFSVSEYAYADGKFTLGGFYKNVTGTRDATGIQQVEQAAGKKVCMRDQVICVVDGEAYVEVYDLAGRRVFQGVTNEVSGLNEGIYMVKVAGEVVKVAVR